MAFIFYNNLSQNRTPQIDKLACSHLRKGWLFKEEIMTGKNTVYRKNFSECHGVRFGEDYYKFIGYFFNISLFRTMEKALAPPLSKEFQHR